MHLLPDVGNAPLAFSIIAAPVFMGNPGYILKQHDCCQCVCEDRLRFQLFFSGVTLSLLGLEHFIMEMISSPTEYKNKNKEQYEKTFIHFTTSV